MNECVVLEWFTTCRNKVSARSGRAENKAGDVWKATPPRDWHQIAAAICLQWCCDLSLQDEDAKATEHERESRNGWLLGGMRDPKSYGCHCMFLRETALWYPTAPVFLGTSGLDPGIPRAVSNKQNKQIGEEDCAHAHRSARKLCTHARYPYPFFPCPPLPRGCTFKPDIDQKSAEMISQRLARLKITGTLCPMAHSIFFRGLCTFTHFLLGWTWHLEYTHYHNMI